MNNESFSCQLDVYLREVLSDAKEIKKRADTLEFSKIFHKFATLKRMFAKH